MIRTAFCRLGCALALAGLAAASAQDRQVAPLPSLAPLIEQVAPAVVNINVKGTAPSIEDPLLQQFLEPFGGAPRTPRPLEGEGSGVIVDAGQGYLLTNHHVIENADEITVSLSDGRSFTATVIGSDADSDLAVLRIDAPGITELPFAAEDDLRVGDYVVAIGNPLGFENTVTAGIVSGLGRNGIGAETYEDFIQTDASINLGNSGGALVNLRGELVGINSAIISQTGGNIGIGLAIPAGMAQNVMRQLIEYGEVRRGLLGVNISDVTRDIARTLELEVDSGAMVTAVEAGSAAEAAGIEINDIIVGVDGMSIDDANELRNTIGLMSPGERVDIELVREGQRRRITATLGTRPAAAANVPGPLVPPDLNDELIDGVTAVMARGPGGAALRVTGVDPESEAAARGLMEGDLITHINRRPVTSFAEVQALMRNARNVVLQVRRGDRDMLLILR